jgi:plasmid stabilization system protein ParE
MARRHVDREKLWWLETGIHAEVFGAEFAGALRTLTRSPGAGTDYDQPVVRGLRRIYLPRTGSHLYYTFDEQDVIVRALWGAHRPWAADRDVTPP